MNPDPPPPSPSLTPFTVATVGPASATLANQTAPELFHPLWLVHPAPLVHIYGLTPFDDPATSLDAAEQSTAERPAALHTTPFAQALRDAFVSECGLPGLPAILETENYGSGSDDAASSHWLPSNKRSAKSSAVTSASQVGGAPGSTQLTSSVKTRFPQDRVRFVFGNQETLERMPARSAPTSPTPLSPRCDSGPLARTGLLTHHWIAKQLMQSPSFTLVFGALDPNAGPIVGSTSAFTLSLPSRPRSRTPSPSADSARRVSAGSELAVEDDDPASTAATPDASNVETMMRTVRNAITLAGGGRVALCLVVPDVSDLDGDWVEDRVSTLRRNLALDRKSVFVMASNANPQELARNFSAAILDPAIKHYAAKAAHLKKKRSRTTAPPSNAVLSPIAWQVRYDAKLAVLAELRGEWTEALTHAQQAYSSLVEHYMQRTDQVRVSDSASGLLVDAETLVGEEEHGALEVFSDRWYEAKALADALVFKIAKLHLMMSKPALIPPLLNAHLMDHLPILPDGPHAAPSTEWLVLDHRASFYAQVARVLIAQYAFPAQASPASGKPSTPAWQRAYLMPHLGLPPSWFTRASQAADAADVHAAQSVPGITLLPVLPRPLLAKAQARPSNMGLAYLAHAVKWATSSAVHAHWPRQVVMAGMALAKRAMDGNDWQVAVEVLGCVAEAVRGQQGGGTAQAVGTHWDQVKRSVLTDLVAAASKARQDTGESVGCNIGQFVAAELSARLQLIALASPSPPSDDHLIAVLDALSCTTEDASKGTEAPPDVVVSSTGLVLLRAKFSCSLVSVYRPITIDIAASPHGLGNRSVFDALMAKLGKVTVAFDDPAYNFELIHSPDGCDTGSTKKWAKQITCNLRPGDAAPEFKWTIELVIPEVTDLHIVSVDLSLCPASPASPTVVLRLSVPPPSQSSLVTPTTSMGVAALHGDASSAPTSLASKPSAHLRVLPAYWDLEYAVYGPETLLVDEVVEATIIVTPKDKMAQEPRELASPLIATVSVAGSTSSTPPTLPTVLGETAPLSQTTGPAIELFPATDSGTPDLGAGGAQVLALPIVKAPDRLSVFLRARHALSASASITVEIGDGPTSLSSSNSSATSPLVASPYPLSPSGVQLNAPGERTLSAILAPIPGSTPPPPPLPARGSTEALTAAPTGLPISSKQAKHMFSVGRRWSATSGSVPRLSSRPTLSFSTHPRTPFLASFSVSPARLRAGPNDTFTEDRVLLVDFTVGPHVAFELINLETVPSASPATLSLVTCPVPVTLRPGDTWRVAVLVTSPVDSEAKLPLGALIVQWRRVDGVDGRSGTTVETKVPLPVIQRKPVSFVVETESARYATQYVPHPIQFTVHNVTSAVHRVSVTIEAGTATIPALPSVVLEGESAASTPPSTTIAAQFSGEKVTQLVLMPGQTHRVSIMAVPLVTGNVDLARCVVSTGEPADDVNSPFARAFVMPEGNAADDGAAAV